MKTQHIISAALAVLLLLPLSSCREDGAAFRSGNEACILSIEPSVSALSADGDGVRSTLLNDESTEAIPFETTDTFCVAAWDIPADDDPTALIAPFETVRYFDTALAEGVRLNSWNTVGIDGKIIERMWYPNETKQFLAYANLPSEGTQSVSAGIDGTTGEPYLSLTHTVPVSADDQTDILLGCYNGTGGGAGRATITFSHPLAAVKLKMGTLTGVASFAVSGISIEGVYAGGTALMTCGSAAEDEPGDRFVWTPDEEGGKPVLTTVSQSVVGEFAAGDAVGVPFTVIPQSFGAGSEARIALSVTVDGSSRTIYIPLAGTRLTAGHATTFTIKYNGHEGVQLWENGPYWADRNIGAVTPEDNGRFFSWGNTTGYTPVIGTLQYTGSYNCTWKPSDGGAAQSNVFTQLFYDTTSGAALAADIPANTASDAAFRNCSPKWRIPTKADFEALFDPENTTVTATTRNKHRGYLIKGKGAFSGRFIFLPSAGYGNGAYYISEETSGVPCGMYWTRTYWNTDYAYSFAWGVSGAPTPQPVQDPRWYGRTIRPVEGVE